MCFGINHEMRDYVHDRKKDLDLVLCTPASSGDVGRKTLASLVETYGVDLATSEEAELAALPVLHQAPVGSVILALEAKACMTEHQKALPRFYDELNSSHRTVHGASAEAIAAGFAMVNIATQYRSPTRSEEIRHDQPRAAGLAIAKAAQLPRRAKVGDEGYDALAIVVVDCANDGSPVLLVEAPPAPQPGDNYHYNSMIHRLANAVATRFQDL